MIEDTDMKKGLVVVTGGSGYIAAFCIARLAEDGWQVRATVRDLARVVQIRSSLREVVPDPSIIDFVEADLNYDKGWNEAFAGAEYVLHIASPLPSANPKDDEILVRPARDGTLRVLKAARDCRVKRVVLTSSISAVVLGRGGRDAPFTEIDWSDENSRRDTTAYDRSKIIAERSAWAWHRSEGGEIGLVVVNPGFVIGPVLPNHSSASILIVKKLMDRSLPALPRFGFALVDVRDLAQLHVLAMTSTAALGHRFNGTGDFLWITDIAAILRKNLAGKCKIPSRPMPDFLVRIAAIFDPVLRWRLYELGQLRRVSSKKALEMLGWRTRPAAESIMDTAQSLLDHKIIR